MKTGVSGASNLAHSKPGLLERIKGKNDPVPSKKVEGDYVEQSIDTQAIDQAAASDERYFCCDSKLIIQAINHNKPAP